MSSFNICPTNSLPRVFRFDLDPDNKGSLLALLDKKRNLLRVNRTKYLSLDEVQQSLVLSTGKVYTSLVGGSNKPQFHNKAFTLETTS